MNFYPEHGLHPKRVTIPLRTDTIMVERNMLFHYVSQYIGIEIDELRTLNPQYRTDLIPGEGNSYPLCLPTDKMNNLIHWADTIFKYSEDSLARRAITVKTAPVEETHQTPSHRSSRKNNHSSSYHRVRRGETLTSIAAKNGTTVSKIKKLNGLKSDRIREGQRLKLR